MKEIGSYAFSSLKSLEIFETSSELTEIGNSAFSYCTNLKTFSAPNAKLTKIGSSAFSGCSGITNLSLSLKSVKNVGSYAFDGCWRIPFERLVFDAETSIGDRAFSYCAGISSLWFGEGFGSLSSGMSFGWCQNITDCYFESIPPEITGRGWNAFYDISPIARGHYPSAYAAEWQAVIDPNTKMWQGLVMEELPSPKLVIDSVSWSDFTLSLSWSKTTTGGDVTVPCSLYRGICDDISQATCILTNSQVTLYTDSGFIGVFSGELTSCCLRNSDPCGSRYRSAECA